jgi:hypothetical protein
MPLHHMPKLEAENPLHFAAVLVSGVEGAWNAHYFDGILAAIGRSSPVVDILLEYLAHEENCSGMRWYGRNGIRMETKIADAIVHHSSCHAASAFDGWAFDLDRKLTAHYSPTIVTRGSVGDPL